jgi:hypothetical protein
MTIASVVLHMAHSVQQITIPLLLLHHWIMNCATVQA